MNEHGGHGQQVAEATAVLRNEAGLHARSAAKLLRVAAEFEAAVTLRTAGSQASARSMMDMLRLGARRGDSIQVMARGVQAREAVEAVRSLIEEGFGEA